MTPPNMKQYHHLNSIHSSKLIYTLMYFTSHFQAISFLLSFGIRTNLLNFLIFVRDIQAITSFPNLPLR